jgi:hypothetical protein
MHTPFNAVAQWWRKWTAARANVASLNCCGSDERDRIAHDVGVTASELRALAGKWPESANLLLNERLAALNLDRTEIRRTEAQVLNDLQRVCTLCTSERACKHDLARSPDDPVWREYCPNVVTLDALTAERAERARQATRARRAKAVNAYFKTLER